ncbi:type II toxin-antitoxin system VapC family toxin [Saccharolobus islandicus]|uniref:PilT protein domain protein n=3 Tax=Saccharolobus islandicus TaxID=43080 RepID=C4KL34_SACI6|nr:type II toxin-antitoxin system VapC family toxin [Sulfolobus islandicus]ACP37228.1 PilT protein domain protein [Sulfolobus islandicus M.14.25]ACP54367.1 PilT protein domain protein [Sulfolobus islandicus M.16.27]ACR40999.1 PilT protein domain protein [Sulfolobus islandicus M.16.4]
MTLLDTSVLIDIIKGKINNVGDSLSIISIMEVIRVLDKVKRLKVLDQLKKTYTIYPLDEKVAIEYSELYYELREKGKLISDLDLIIASTAKAYNERLVTKDKDFLSLSGYIEIKLIQ